MNGPAPLPRHLGIYGPDPQIPPGTMLILDDRMPVLHDPARTAALAQALEAESVLLDFEREPDLHSISLAHALFQALPCPVAAPPGFLEDPACPVFLSPCPLHIPLADYLHPWQGREVWLDVTVQQETITVTPEGTRYGSPVPADRQDGGWFDETLCCWYITKIVDDFVRFTLFDTPETLSRKLEQAAALGVTRAVGLYQELYGKL